jgi:hypothetical protein
MISADQKHLLLMITAAVGLVLPCVATVLTLLVMAVTSTIPATITVMISAAATKALSVGASPTLGRGP